MSRQTAQESLQVVSALLNEDLVRVTDRFLRWDLRNRNAWPPVSECLVQNVELVVASLALKHALLVPASDLINSLATGAGRVATSEVKVDLVYAV